MYRVVKDLWWFTVAYQRLKPVILWPVIVSTSGLATSGTISRRGNIIFFCREFSFFFFLNNVSYSFNNIRWTNNIGHFLSFNFCDSTSSTAKNIVNYSIINSLRFIFFFYCQLTIPKVDSHLLSNHR